MTWCEMAIFLVGILPKLWYICWLLYNARYNNIKDPKLVKKILIFTNYPAEIWFVLLFLCIMGLNYLKLNSG